MIDIIVVGYPKSGNTWVTRLVAELVGCPSVGFLNNTDWEEIATEGLDRVSDYQCFKAHHQYHELSEIKTNERRIIYVVRDPRDIAISGAKYFGFQKWPALRAFLEKLPLGYRTYHKFLHPLNSSEDYRMKRMVQTVLHGSENFSPWLKVSWAAHLKPYLEHDCFFVRYEDLLSNPDQECQRILNYLKLERSPEQIQEAIKKQSFENKKEAFQEIGDSRNARFLRSGKKEQWKTCLSPKQKSTFVDLLSDQLRQLGYPVSDESE